MRIGCQGANGDQSKARQTTHIKNQQVDRTQPCDYLILPMATGKDGELLKRVIRAACYAMLAELDREDAPARPRTSRAPALPAEVDQKAAQKASLELMRAGLLSAHGNTKARKR
jgi:hypothetical protein